MKYIEIKVVFTENDINFEEIAEDIKDNIYQEFDVKDVFWEVKEENK